MARTTRARGFKSWKPGKDVRAVVDAAKEVLDEYHAQLPLTLRQIFYRLVARGIINKDENSYKRLGDYMVKARRAHMIDMDVIRDDGFSMSYINTFEDGDDVIGYYRRIANRLNVDRQRGQQTRLMIWCEAQGMKPMLERVANYYGVVVASSGGFDSLTTKHDIARDLSDQGDVIVLHLGDHDPSGVHMFSSLDEDINEFIDYYGGTVEFIRLAVTPEQIDDYQLPTAPPKKTDRRSFEGNETVQCEAIPPDVLLDIVRDAIEGWFDMDLFEEVLEEEKVVRQDVLSRLG